MVCKHFLTPGIIPDNCNDRQLKQHPQMGKPPNPFMLDINLHIGKYKFDKEKIKQKIAQILHLQRQRRLVRLAGPEQQKICSIHDETSNIGNHQVGGGFVLLLPHQHKNTYQRYYNTCHRYQHPYDSRTKL